MNEERPKRTHCEAHGLVYDPEAHSGCVLCRREQAEEAPDTPKPRSLEIRVIALALGAVLLSIFVGVVYSSNARQEGPMGPDASAEAGSVVSPVRGVPEHKGTIMLGLNGNDEYGYPRNLPDKLTLQRLLREKRFKELSSHIESFQASAEEDFRNEQWLTVGIQAFDTADRRIGRLINQWAKATPDSFAPYLARARHRIALAQRFRNHKGSDLTPKKRFASMRRILLPALLDIERVLERSPSSTEARSTELAIAADLGFDISEKSEIVERGLQHCPYCFGIRASHLSAIAPRRGGSYALMDGAAAEWQLTKENPKLEQLLGFADLDRCRELTKEDPQGALAPCDQALTRGRHPLFLSAKAATMAELERYDEAIALFTEALEKRPQDAQSLSGRGYALMNAKRYDQATRDLVLATRLDPANTDAKDRLYQILEELLRVAHYQAEAGELDAAIAAYDRMLTIDPRYADALSHRGRAYFKQGDLEKAEKDLRRAIALDPTSVESYQGLDHVLSQQQRIDEIVRLWSRYLKRRPRDPTALFARSTTYYRKGERELAWRDVTAACRFGNKEACGALIRFYPSP